MRKCPIKVAQRSEGERKGSGVLLGTAHQSHSKRIQNDVKLTQNVSTNRKIYRSSKPCCVMIEATSYDVPWYRKTSLRLASSSLSGSISRESASSGGCHAFPTPGVSWAAETVFGRPCHRLLPLGSGLGLVGTASERR